MSFPSTRPLAIPRISILRGFRGRIAVLARACAGDAFEDGREMLPVAGVVPTPAIEKSGTTVTVHDILTIDDSSNDRLFMRVQIDYVAPLRNPLFKGLTFRSRNSIVCLGLRSAL